MIVIVAAFIALLSAFWVASLDCSGTSRFPGKTFMCGLKSSPFQGPSSPNAILSATESPKTDPVAEAPSIESEPADVKGHVPLKLFAAGHCIKKEESTSEHICGEDAFLINLEGHRPFVGVADGVGGWNANGGDSSKVSRAFLANVDKNIQQKDKANLEVALRIAFAEMAASKELRQGSTTISIVVFDSTKNTVEIVNVGDSATLIVRGQKVIRRSRLGQEMFNAPHQLGFDETGNPYGSIDSIERIADVEVKAGDVIILASDGVLDNLYDEELASLVTSMVKPARELGRSGERVLMPSMRAAALQERLQTIATTIGQHAYALSKETQWTSPFAKSALEHGYLFMGGKQDDISIVVALVAPEM